MTEPEPSGWALVPRDCELSVANTLANRVQEYLKYVSKSLSRSTYRGIKNTLENFEIYVGRKSLTKQLIMGWTDHISPGNKLTTIVKKNNQLKAFLRWCDDNQFMDGQLYRFFPKLKLPAYPLPSIYTEREYETIKDATMGTDNYYLTVLGYRTGMSMVDCCHLRWSHIDLDQLMIRSARIKMLRHGESAVFWVPVLANGDLHQMLNQLKEAHVDKWNNANDDYVNPDLAGLYGYHQTAVVKNYKKVLAKIGIKGKTFKNFRNTFISNIANSGMNLALACKLTAHRDPAIFASYIRPDPEALRAGVQAAFQWAAEKETIRELRKVKP